MTPALRLAISLVLSLLLWLPTLPSALRLGDTPEMIAVRYLLALLVARIGVGLVFRIVGTYAAGAEADAEAEEPAADDTSEPVFGRRRDDWEEAADAADADAPTEEELLDAALDEAQDAAALAS